MPIINLSLVVACALFLNFPVLSQVPTGGETGEQLKQKALALMDHGRPKEAAAFREALKSAPRDPEIFNDLGVALRKAGDFTGSLDALQAVLRLRPDDARIQSNMASRCTRWDA
jgi:Flp pilus assembly protein TadD